MRSWNSVFGSRGSQWQFRRISLDPRSGTGAMIRINPQRIHGTLCRLLRPGISTTPGGRGCILGRESKGNQFLGLAKTESLRDRDGSRNGGGRHGVTSWAPQSAAGLDRWTILAHEALKAFWA